MRAGAGSFTVKETTVRGGTEAGKGEATGKSWVLVCVHYIIIR